VDEVDFRISDPERFRRVAAAAATRRQNGRNASQRRHGSDELHVFTYFDVGP
jgi:hypothetical protein